MSIIRSANVIRYVTPLREGGSLPAIVEADDGFMYVMKFRGAGQGSKALIAEIIGGELARAIGLKMPEIVFLELDAGFGRTEPDEEIQDLLKFSEGLNLGLHYLAGAVTYDPAVFEIDALEASKIVWLDAFLTNVDRTVKNTNMLVWKNELWMIDHGASLYFHHNITDITKQSITTFPIIKDHVLLSIATKLEEANSIMKSILKPELIKQVVDLIPNSWLVPTDKFQDLRAVYEEFLTNRMNNSDIFYKQIQDARSSRI